MEGSGCGQSTVLRHLVGLKEPAKGEIFYGDFNFTQATPEQRELLMRRFGILYQGGALWSSMTLAENVGLPLGEFTDLKAEQIRQIAILKLALAGLKGFEDYFRNQNQRRDAEAGRDRAGDGARSGFFSSTSHRRVSIRFAPACSTT
jgi:phospholipid/cholesterol/gamma-HCH transport system ATP-binding protein